MTNYKEQVYQFLTNPENFETAGELNEQFARVKDKMIADFWNEVLSALDHRSDGSDLSVGRKPAEGEKVSEIFISVNEKPEIKVSLGDLETKVYYGIEAKDQVHLVESIKTYPKWDLSRRAAGWPAWDYYRGLNLTEIRDLVKLLPAHRVATVNEVADVLWNLAKDVKEEVNRGLSTKK